MTMAKRIPTRPPIVFRVRRKYPPSSKSPRPVPLRTSAQPLFSYRKNQRRETREGSLQMQNGDCHPSPGNPLLLTHCSGSVAAFWPSARTSDPPRSNPAYPPSEIHAFPNKFLSMLYLRQMLFRCLPWRFGGCLISPLRRHSVPTHPTYYIPEPHRNQVLYLKNGRPHCLILARSQLIYLRPNLSARWRRIWDREITGAIQF